MILKYRGEVTHKGCGRCGRYRDVNITRKCYYTIEGRICFTAGEKKEVSDNVGGFLLSLNTDKVVFEKC